MPRNLRTQFGTLAATAALFVGAGLTATAAERVSARIKEPVVFDGETYPAGVLRVTEIQNYTPGATLNEVLVGGEWVGMVIARMVEGAPAADGTSLVFKRNATGTLVLEGMTMRNRPEMRFMTLPKGRASVARPSR